MKTTFNIYLASGAVVPVIADDCELTMQNGILASYKFKGIPTDCKNNFPLYFSISNIQAIVQEVNPEIIS